MFTCKLSILFSLFPECTVMALNATRLFLLNSDHTNWTVSFLHSRMCPDWITTFDFQQSLKRSPPVKNRLSSWLNGMACLQNLNCIYFLQLAQGRHGINCNLVLSLLLCPPCSIWSTSPWWWSDKEKVQEVESRRGGEEDSGSTTKISFRFRWQSRMSGRESTRRQLFRKEEYDSQWIDMPSLGSFGTSWAQSYWSGRAQPLQEPKWRSGRSLVLHHWPSQDVGTLPCS